MFYNFVRLFLGTFIRLVYPLKVHNLDNLPKEGAVILCSNHANNLDPIFISIVLSRQVSWMAKKELFSSGILSFLLNKLDAFPVDRQGSDISAIKRAIRTLKSNKVLGIFPEGTRTKVIDLNKAKAGVALIAVKTKAPILPVYIESNYKAFKKTNIYIGQIMNIPTDKSTKYDADDYSRISRDILENIYKLKNKEEID